MTSNLVDFAAGQQSRFESATTAAERKARGHFGTPAAVADFMAGLADLAGRRAVRVLDPGAGVGLLSAAVCQRALRNGEPTTLDFELWEDDPAIQPFLRSTMEHCRERLNAAGHRMSYEVRQEDFILASDRRSLFDVGAVRAFDLAIVNPPYFKLRKDSPHARVMSHVVHGQPNAYAFFMAVAVDLLTTGGDLVAITPRSYFNGPYFRRFRSWLLGQAALRHVHLFESREGVFDAGGVLQESVIASFRKGATPREVAITSSLDRGLQATSRHALPYGSVVAGAEAGHIIRVATDAAENDLVRALDGLPHRFDELGYIVSTGPVVAFRAAELLRTERAGDTAPLLGSSNVRPFVTRRSPRSQGRPAHIVVEERSRKLLLPADRYVLLKRFTAKEERRRLVAGLFEATDSYAPLVGFENHLNYIHLPGDRLSAPEAVGLAAYLNSALVDCYFRAISGSTQVNATEIRRLPMPDRATIRDIGRALPADVRRVQGALERVVGDAIGVPGRIIERFGEPAA